MSDLLYDVLLIANGARPGVRQFKRLVDCSARLIAVDGGVKFCRKLGRRPSVLIGDLDSVSKEDIAWVKRGGAEVVHKPSQNATDLEKAFAYCRRHKLRRIAALAAVGDRFDHSLYGFDLAFRFHDLRIHFHLPNTLVIPLRGRVTLHVSLEPFHRISWLGYPRADGCFICGAEWPLRGETLRSDGKQSISNHSLGPIEIKQKSGRSLLMIHRRVERPAQ